MRHLGKAQKLELIQFIDDRVAHDADGATLARVIDDGQSIPYGAKPASLASVWSLFAKSLKRRDEDASGG
jgi:hypothetical protein